MDKTLRIAALSAALGGVIAMSGCSTAQQAQFSRAAARADQVLQAACSDALALGNIAGLVPGVGAIIPYINAGCATADGLAKLASDPSSTQWVGQLIGQVKALAGNVGFRV